MVTDASARLGPAGARDRVAIFGIDNFSRKNRAQVVGLNERGYVFDVFTNDRLGDSHANLPPGNTATVVASSFAARVRQVARYIRAERRRLYHVEVYAGGRFSAVYVLVARLFGVPVMAVERGDVQYLRQYGLVTALSMWACYRLATEVWYRELYQERRLRALGVRRLFFLPNAVKAAADVARTHERTVDFVWSNRLIAERKPSWVVRQLARPEFARTRNAMLGFLDERLADAGTLANQAYAREHRPANLELRDYCDPAPVLRVSRYFLLPSDIVFCNNALLEAMAAGVVPLVSDVEGARLIVDDGVNGFVFPHSEDGLARAMRAAVDLAPADYERMSRAAAEKVRTHFSLDRWLDALAAEYARLRGGAPAPAPARATTGVAA